MHIINTDHAVGFIAGIVYLMVGIALILIVDEKTNRISNFVGDSAGLSAIFWLFWWLVVPFVFLPRYKRTRPFFKGRS